MKVTITNNRKDKAKGLHNWQFSVTAPGGRSIRHFHIAEACSYPYAESRLRKFLKTLNEPEVLVEVL